MKTDECDFYKNVMIDGVFVAQIFSSELM